MNLSKIWLHNMNTSRFLFLISLPNTEDFSKEEAFVYDTMTKLRGLGVDVYSKIDADVMSQMTKYEYVIVVAHHDTCIDSLVLRDGNLAMSDFISYVPEDFSGVIDFSSCYSAGVMAMIKQRTHNKCRVQTVVKQTTLALRLIMYPHIIQLLLNDRCLQYNDAYSQVLNFVTIGFSQRDDNASCLLPKEKDSNTQTAPKLGDKITETATKLGGEESFSTIYAPSQVKRNQPFLVNIFFHKDEESGAVELLAQRLDPKTSLVDTQIIPIDLKLKDKLTARMSINGGNSTGINVNNGIDTKSIIWFNRATKIQFPVTVNDDFIGDSLICEIKIEVNSDPIGECVFVISVFENSSQVPCSISLVPYNKDTEQMTARVRLRNQFKQNLNRLEDEIENAGTEQERNILKSQYDVCKKCINLVDEANIREVNDEIIKVFISSTSDMAQYRDIVKNEIVSCGMFPVDYRTWYQSEQQPCDVCCKSVMESDVILCLIGSRYGYEEPSIGISMTQMEFWTALMSGKKILAYIIDPLEESTEEEVYKIKQKEFIKELQTKRILKFFSDDYSLEKDTTRELSYLKR